MVRRLLRLGLASALVLAALVAGSIAAPKASAQSPFIYPYRYPRYIYPYYPYPYYPQYTPIYIRAYIPPPPTYSSGYGYSSFTAYPSTYPYASAYARPAITVTGQSAYPSAAYGAAYSPAYTSAPPATGYTSSASSYATVQVSMSSTLGSYLSGGNGMTLYTLSSDGTVGASTCFSTCASVWPPFTTSDGPPAAPSGVTGKFGVTMRSDGTLQVTYNGRPLYYFSGDKSSGQTNGQGVMDEWGTWSVAKP
jgi:predicted lipoprotein with Yx(FWY)xxD motif